MVSKARTLLQRARAKVANQSADRERNHDVTDTAPAAPVRERRMLSPTDKGWANWLAAAPTDTKQTTEE